MVVGIFAFWKILPLPSGLEGVCVWRGGGGWCESLWSGEADVSLIDAHLKVSIVFLQLLIASVVCLDMVFLIFISLDVCSAFWKYGLMATVLKHSQLLSSQITFQLLSINSSRTLIRHRLNLLTALTIFLILSSAFHPILFPLCALSWVFSINVFLFIDIGISIDILIYFLVYLGYICIC